MSNHIKLNRIMGLILCVILLVSLVGCGTSVKEMASNAVDKAIDKATDKVVNEVLGEAMANASGGSNYFSSELIEGFPDNVPIYENSKIIESDNFDSNAYTLVYSSDASFDDILEFYVDAFDLDASQAETGSAYYSDFQVDQLEIKGLSIEGVGESVNVFITFRDLSQPAGMGGDDFEDSDEDEAYEDEYDDYGDSDIITYDNAEVIDLPSDYPSDVVPIFEPSKLISASLVPGVGSGFLDLMLPEYAFEDAAQFYVDLGLDKSDRSSTIQKAIEFRGQLGDYKVTILLSHLQMGGNDPYMQIVLDKK